MIAERVKVHQVVKRYESCLRLVDENGKPFDDSEKEGKSVFGNACIPKVVSIDSRPHLVILRMINIKKERCQQETRFY